MRLHAGDGATTENANVRGAGVSPRLTASTIENPEPGTRGSKTAGACQRLARPGGAPKRTPPAGDMNSLRVAPTGTRVGSIGAGTWFSRTPRWVGRCARAAG